jgi:hypothetical protein
MEVDGNVRSGEGKRGSKFMSIYDKKFKVVKAYKTKGITPTQGDFKPSYLSPILNSE